MGRNVDQTNFWIEYFWRINWREPSSYQREATDENGHSIGSKYTCVFLCDKLSAHVNGKCARERESIKSHSHTYTRVKREKNVRISTNMMLSSGRIRCVPKNNIIRLEGYTSYILYNLDTMRCVFSFSLRIWILFNTLHTHTSYSNSHSHFPKT